MVLKISLADILSDHSRTKGNYFQGDPVQVGK